MSKFFLSIIFIFPVLFCVGQRKTKLNTNGEGTMFFSGGINRSAYSSADVSLEGNNYSIILGELSLTDSQNETSPLSLFGSENHQFNIQIGYFISNKWAIIGGYDRYNTFFKTEQPIELSGTFSPSSHSNYSGTYDNESIDLDVNDFNLMQSQGMNFFNIGALRMDQWYKSRKAEFAFNTVAGAKFGPIFSMVDYTFDNSTRQQISSLSGVGFTGFAGIRLDFFQHIYLETIISGGYLNQSNIDLSTTGSETAGQKVAFISPQVNLGFSFFARPTNGCGTCPQW
tara:strand:- start:89948 stop:90799 length:852 start_codon:yes stop_codon:yes gene_type:complete